jgi:Fe-S-cluster containining protein
MATKTKRLRVLNEIYDALPSVNCKGLCWTNCAYINVLPIEVVNIEQATGAAPELIAVPNLVNGKPMPMIKPTAGDQCPYLIMRRCSIYERRPLICRVYGSGAGLRCPHGCQPSRVIPDQEVESAIRKIEKL